ncbi:hypothetical protein [Streptomyces aureus]|uniref:hypothetical protein n=1 Tax=Streptomyces aureus TaxID=193461 RepID=UPI0005697BAC|nr:hypothetical protein [Streptomyces aureus]
MTEPRAKASHRAAETELVITRADGTVIPLGRGAYWHRNPLRRLWWRLWGQPRFNRRARAANRAARAADTQER